MMIRNLRKLNNESGFVIVAVIVLTIVMMIFAVGIVALNSGSTISTRHQIDRLKAEQLAKGAHWVNYMSLMVNGTQSPDISETLDGKSFTVTITSAGAGTGPNSTELFDYAVTLP